MHIAILSDLHLGKGHYFKDGQINIMEEFEEDERFFEFVEYYSSGEFENEEVHLVLNGDILNLIQIDFEGIYTTCIDEEMTVSAIGEIVKGHTLFFKALNKFSSKPGKKIIYVIGNHDNGMAFPLAQKKFNEIVGNPVHFTHTYKYKSVHVEHGHRFEAINAVPMNKFFVPGPRGRDILNLPWGSLFCISILPLLKKDRPNIDKVRPLSTYVKWCVFHDFFFFLKMAMISGLYCLKTILSSLSSRTKTPKISLNILKQITIHPKYEKQAKRILKRHEDVQIVVMGHTHVSEFRVFSEGKSYYNCGTWNPIFSLDAGKYKTIQNLTYVLIKIDDENGRVLYSRLNKWQGHWRPFLQMVEN
jgi:UDP-2,3-diacylglucosamine pyrophosphatase LpxH